MRLKNILLVVDDIEKSIAFYKELFGLRVVTDFEGNVILTEGLVLQDRKIWEQLVGKETVYGGSDAELYFIENDIDSFQEKVNNSCFEIHYVHEMKEHAWGQRVIRIYDPDMHMIEIGESMECVARRFLKQGMSVEETAAKTQLPLSQVEEIAKYEE